MEEKATGAKKHQHKQQEEQQQPWQQQQQKNKKARQAEKKKNMENGMKLYKRDWLISPYSKNNVYRNKKNKFKNSNSNNSNRNINKFSKKKSGSDDRSFLWTFFTRVLYVLLILGFIYIINYEEFVRIRDRASYYVNKTVSLLPAEVLTKGKLVIEFLQPVAEVTLNKANAFVKTTSSFLETNPLVKDHWTNIKEISAICSARLVDYMWTLYVQITGYYNDVKIWLGDL